MPPVRSIASSDMNLPTDEVSCRSTSRFSGIPREALLRSIFRTGDLDKIVAVIGSGSTAGSLSSLDVVLSTGETLLHLAVTCDRKDILLYLLKQEVFVDEPDEFSQTALQLAATEENFDMVKLLLEHGADPFMRQSSRFLPLSVVQGDCRILTLLMSACGKRMRGHENVGHTAENIRIDPKSKRSWSEPNLPKLVARIDIRGNEAAGPSPPELAKARSRTLPLGLYGHILPGKGLTNKASNDGFAHDTIDGSLSKVSPSPSRDSIPPIRGSGERKSIRMRVDTLVNRTIRRRHTERPNPGPKNTLAMEPAWIEGMPPSLRFTQSLAANH